MSNFDSVIRLCKTLIEDLESLKTEYDAMFIETTNVESAVSKSLLPPEPMETSAHVRRIVEAHGRLTEDYGLVCSMLGRVVGLTGYQVQEFVSGSPDQQQSLFDRILRKSMES